MNLDEATIERRLRDTYEAVSDTVDIPAPSVNFLPSTRGAHGVPRLAESRGRRARTVIAAFAAVLVVAIVVAVVAVNNSSSPRERQPSAPTTLNSPDLAPIFPTYPDHHGAPLLLAPTYVPDGFHLVVSTPGGGGMTRAGSPGGTVQYWVKLDPAQRQPLASFQVTWGPADLSEAAKQSGFADLGPQLHGDALDTYRAQSVPTTVAGHDALYSEGLATFAWEQNHQLVTVSGAINNPIGAWPEHLSRDELANIAAHLVRDPDGHYTLTEPPEGFRLSAEEPSFASSGTNTRVLAYADSANGDGFAIQLADNSQDPPGVKLANPPARLTTIRNQRAVVTPYLNGGPGCSAADEFLCAGAPLDPSHLSIIWTEPDNTTVIVTAVGISHQQLLDIAHGLTPVQPSEWPVVGNFRG